MWQASHGMWDQKQMRWQHQGVQEGCMSTATRSSLHSPAAVGSQTRCHSHPAVGGWWTGEVPAWCLPCSAAGPSYICLMPLCIACMALVTGCMCPHMSCHAYNMCSSEIKQMCYVVCPVEDMKPPTHHRAIIALHQAPCAWVPAARVL
jgi:hypothetical protein